LAFNFKGIRKVIKILIFILDLTIILISFSNTNEDKKWPGLEIWNFVHFFTEDVKKNHIFPQFFGYIAICLVPVGGQLCVLRHFLFAVFFYIQINLLNFLTV
jgi:hypothetical protein